MQSKAATVEEYMQGVPAERREALERLRALCIELLPGYDEGMEYGMPCYKRGETMGFAFASQVQYISVYGMTAQVVEGHKGELVGASMGKGCLRYKNPAKMDFVLLRRMMLEALKLKGRPSA